MSAPGKPYGLLNPAHEGVNPARARRVLQALERSAERGRDVMAENTYPAISEYGEYANNVGPAAPGLGGPSYQRQGRDRLGDYVANPFDGGLQRWGRQATTAPFGGWVRRNLEGKEVFGHTMTRADARLAERATAGVLAAGVGGAALLAAIDNLSNPQTPGTIPMY